MRFETFSGIPGYLRQAKHAALRRHSPFTSPSLNCDALRYDRAAYGICACVAFVTGVAG